MHLRIFESSLQLLLLLFVVLLVASLVVCLLSEKEHERLSSIQLKVCHAAAAGLLCVFVCVCACASLCIVVYRRIGAGH